MKPTRHVDMWVSCGRTSLGSSLLPQRMWTTLWVDIRIFTWLLPGAVRNMTIKQSAKQAKQCTCFIIHSKGMPDGHWRAANIHVWLSRTWRAGYGHKWVPQHVWFPFWWWSIYYLLMMSQYRLLNDTFFWWAVGSCSRVVCIDIREKPGQYRAVAHQPLCQVN